MRFFGRVLAAIALLVVSSACSNAAAPTPTTVQSPTLTQSADTRPTGTLTPIATPAATPTLAIDPVSGLPFVNLAELPPEAADTVALIKSDGPFPYSQDGVTFQNREGILPDGPSGYYHEYTVKTLGSEDRGARRIVSGSDGGLYYTGDHYGTFERIRDE